MGGRKIGLAIRRKNRERKNKERKGEARRRLTMTLSISPELLKVSQLIVSLPLAAYVHSEVESLYSYSYFICKCLDGGVQIYTEIDNDDVQFFWSIVGADWEEECSATLLEMIVSQPVGENPWIFTCN